MGICGILLFTLGDIEYADRHGYIPVVDLQTYPNTYLAASDVNKWNAWDFFFDGNKTVDIQTLCQTGNVIIHDGILNFEMPDYDILMNHEAESPSLHRWKKILKKYIYIKKDILTEADRYISTFFGDKKILGVLCRGTDFTSLKPKNHPRQPDVDEVIRKADFLIRNHHFDGIFLATEDHKIFFEFKNNFHEKLFCYFPPSVLYKDNYFITNIPINTKIRYENAKKYLISILILSKCDSFIGGITSGSIASLLFSEKYQYTYIWKLGYY